MAEKKTPATGGKSSKRAEIIRTLGAISIDDLKNEEEFKACFALKTLLVGEKKARKKRGSKTETKGATSAPTVDTM